MKRFLFLPSLMLLAGCLPIGDAEQILVEGEALIQATPDLFDISASINSRAETRERALSEIAETYAVLKDQLPRLEGVEKISITTSGANVGPVYDFQCQQNTYTEAECPIVAYRGAISVSIEGAPANKAGGMLSLASQLGASEVAFDGFRVSNMPEY